MKKLLFFSFLAFGMMLGSNPVSAATFTYAGSPYTLNVGTALIATPTTTGYSFITGYSINKTLPAGLMFNAGTGVITGTPTAVSVTTIYIITLSYNFGFNTTTTTISITVNAGTPPHIAYTTPDTYITGASVSLSPTSTGGAVTSYSAPSLPAGLTIAATTGIISGTVTTPGTGNYIVTATNSGGSYPFTINITINNPPPPSLTYTSGNVYTVGNSYTLTPTYGGSYVPTSCTISPTLPAGLSINNSGVISGTPSAASTVITYTVTATNAGGSAPSNSFTITVLPKKPVITYTSPNVYYVGAPITPLSPNSTGGPVASYSVSSLPAGLSIDPTTGIISGTPTAVTPSNTYTVTATNAGGTGTFPITITVNAPYVTGASITAGLAGTTLNSSQNNIAIYGLSLQATGTPSFTALTFTASKTIGTYFPSVTLYSSASNSFSSSTANVVTGAAYSYPSSTTLTVTLPSAQTLVNGASIYYYLVVNYVEPATAATFQISISGITGSATSGSAPGQVYTLGPITINWVGGTATGSVYLWSTPANWNPAVVPGPGDKAQIGVALFTSSHSPTINTAATVGSVIFGSNNNEGTNGTTNIGVTANSTLTVNGDISLQADNGSNGVQNVNFSGTGAIKAVNLNILSDYDLLDDGDINTFLNDYTQFLNSSVTNLNLSGNLALTTEYDNFFFSFYYNAEFNLTAGTASVGGKLTSANENGGSTSTFIITPSIGATPVLQLAGPAALSGLSAAGSNVVTFNNANATVEYSGAAQTVYTNLPLTGLTNGPSYYSVKFSGTGIKTPNGTAVNALNIAGDFTNTLANDPANNVLLTNTIVNFNGNNNQNLAGGAGPTYSTTSTIVAPNPAGTVFNVVNFSNGGANTAKTMVSGGFAVASTGVLTMVGSSSYTVLNANGNLTLNSSATSSATVAKITAGGPSIIGNVNVQRYVTGGAGYRGYRLMSSPVNGTADAYPANYSLNYLIKSTYLRGTSGIGFDGPGNDNIFLYRENLAPSNTTFTSGNYNGINSLGTAPNYKYPIDGNTGSPTFSIPLGNGFLFFFRGDRLVAPYATETVSTYLSTSAIITATGKLNQGAVAVKDWYNSGTTYLGFTNTTANSAVRGFNLVGNPYASTIDLTTASTTAGAGLQLSAPIGGKGIETNFYELNPLTQNFEVWSNALGTGTNKATRYIASGQGFFVKTDTVNQTLTFNETAKVNNQNTGLNLFMATRGDVAMVTKGSSEDQHLRLQMAMDSVNTDDIYIAFNSSAQSKYVVNEDATYRPGQGKVSISSFSSDNVSLAISAMALPKGTETIKLYIGAANDGIYTLNITELKNIPVKYQVWLMDAYKKDSLDMRHNTTYTFNLAHADTSSFGANRFSLVLREDPALKLHLLDFTAAKAVAGAALTWKTENEDVTTLFTVQRSTDKGTTFEDFGNLQSNAGGGYSYQDKNPVVPQDAYRLKLTDLDGNVTYSAVITLMYSGLNDGIAKSNIVIYPNPANGIINLAVIQNSGIVGGIINYLNTSLIDSRTAKAQTQQVSTMYSIKIISNTGSVVKSATSSQPVWQTNVSSLLPGTYVIQVTNSKDNTSVGRGTFVKL